ncbi:MAG: hypothetical protein ABIR16_02120 [Dokdonella sp.]
MGMFNGKQDRGWLQRSSALVTLGAMTAALAGYASQAIAASVTINWTIPHQTIDGFGASDAFVNVALTDAQADLFFSASTGIGLSFLRMGIANDGGLNGGAFSDATKAAARGARVWAAAWTAPGAWKDNGTTSNGGHLCAAPGQGACTATHYDNWATRLAGFSTTLKQSSGADLYALSVQNEPDFVASYDSMIVSDSEFVGFVNTLAPKLAAISPRPKLIVGEHANWNLLWPMASAIEVNPMALAAVDVYGTHQYYGVSAYQGPRPKPLWQTEISSFDAFDPSISNGVTVAKWINDALTVGNANVWHYWWLQNPYNETNEGLIGHPSAPTAPTKRLYSVGNYSKFVRPGWTRIDVAGTNPNLFTTAYRSPSNAGFAIVVVNNSGGDLPFVANLVSARVTTVTPWVTSASLNLAVQSPVVVSAGQFTTTVPFGVTTFVGVNDAIFASGFE